MMKVPPLWDAVGVPPLLEPPPLLDPPPPPDPPQPAARATAAIATVATIPRQNRCSITPPRKVVAARSMTRKRPSMLVLRRVEQPDVRCGGGPREALGGGRRGREGGDRDEAVALVDQRDVVANVPQLALLRGDHP